MPVTQLCRILSPTRPIAVCATDLSARTQPLPYTDSLDFRRSQVNVYPDHPIYQVHVLCFCRIDVGTKHRFGPVANATAAVESDPASCVRDMSSWRSQAGTQSWINYRISPSTTHGRPDQFPLPGLAKSRELPSRLCPIFRMQRPQLSWQTHGHPA
ncbi:hypothetical protein BDV12DRAFT_32221 [Aspergillus spectabilis]